jgi:hypothetical protein
LAGSDPVRSASWTRAATMIAPIKIVRAIETICSKRS